MSKASAEHPEARRSRRVTKPAKPGVDPAPATSGSELAGEDDPRSWGDAGTASNRGENDERLKRDKPPHWG